LKPGETVEMPVVFYIDPSINEDPTMKDVEEITLSYTFFKYIE
jgi:cytochrome c oxidase assembly protein subunit 11